MATVVGYLVVSRPFLNLSDPRHLHSSHSELLEVRENTHTSTVCGLPAESIVGGSFVSWCDNQAKIVLTFLDLRFDFWMKLNRSKWKFVSLSC